MSFLRLLMLGTNTQNDKLENGYSMDTLSYVSRHRVCFTGKKVSIWGIHFEVFDFIKSFICIEFKRSV